MRIVGVLLAAGAGVRFGGGKLLAKLDDGTAIGARCCATLVAALGEVIAVVRPGDLALSGLLAREGARVSVCETAASGMSASVAHGASTAADTGADAIVVALADMPWVEVRTVRAIAAALDEGSTLVVPRYKGRRGNPIGFGRTRFDELRKLDGDRGARDLIGATPSVCWVDVDDPGIVRDVDTPEDLRA